MAFLKTTNYANVTNGIRVLIFVECHEWHPLGVSGDYSGLGSSDNLKTIGTVCLVLMAWPQLVAGKNLGND